MGEQNREWRRRSGGGYWGGVCACAGQEEGSIGGGSSAHNLSLFLTPLGLAPSKLLAQA